MYERWELEREAKANGIYNIENRHGKPDYRMTPGQETALIRELLRKDPKPEELKEYLKTKTPIFYKAYLDEEK